MLARLAATILLKRPRRCDDVGSHHNQANAAGKRAYKNISGWTAAVSKARKALGVKGFVAVKKGTALYAKAKSFYKK